MSDPLAPMEAAYQSAVRTLRADKNPRLAFAQGARFALTVLIDAPYSEDMEAAMLKLSADIMGFGHAAIAKEDE